MRDLVIENIPTSEPNHFVRMELTYNMGGINYFTYKREPRGYYLHCHPYHIETMTSLRSEVFTLGDGAKDLIEETKRLSVPRMKALAESVKSNPKYAALLQTVCERKGVTLKREEVANG